MKPFSEHVRCTQHSKYTAATCPVCYALALGQREEQWLAQRAEAHAAYEAERKAHHG